MACRSAHFAKILFVKYLRSDSQKFYSTKICRTVSLSGYGIRSMAIVTIDMYGTTHAIVNLGMKLAVIKCDLIRVVCVQQLVYKWLLAYMYM